MPRGLDLAAVRNERVPDPISSGPLFRSRESRPAATGTGSVLGRPLLDALRGSVVTIDLMGVPALERAEPVGGPSLVAARHRAFVVDRVVLDRSSTDRALPPDAGLGHRDFLPSTRRPPVGSVRGRSGPRHNTRRPRPFHERTGPPGRNLREGRAECSLGTSRGPVYRRDLRTAIPSSRSPGASRASALGSGTGLSMKLSMCATADASSAR